VATYLLRHANAGNRRGWEGPDEERPLSAKGRAQSEAIADQLAKADPMRLLTSPYVRCVQTLEPLGERLGLAVEHEPALAEGQPVESVLHLLNEVPDGTVLCSHGDIVADTIDALIRRGAVLDGQPEWRKGSWWVLESDGDGVLHAHAEPPPA
jgi:phosphohistidine phosphatase SixA